MNLQHLSGNRIASSATIPNVSRSLRPGQIIQGKIMKLYPDQKAHIQLGSQKMVAQLEASLTAGGNYHFQVQPSDDVVHLRVIGEQLQNKGAGNMMALLQQLGLKATRANAALVRSLINEKIPFTKEQLERAFHFLNLGKNSSQAQQTIKSMFSAGLPINNSIYQALISANTSGVTEQVESLLLQLRKSTDQTGLQQNLTQRLSQLIEPPSSNMIVNQSILETSSNNQQLFQVLKTAGVIDSNMDFSKWKTEWTRFSKQIGNFNGQLPFQLNHAETFRLLEHLQKNSISIRDVSQALIRQWSSTIESAAADNQSLANAEFSRLNQQISASLMPLMTTTQQQQLTNLIQNNPVSMQQLLTILQTLAGNQTYMTIANVLPLLKMGNSLVLSSPKDQFLSQIQHVLRSAGLNYENQLATNNINEHQSNVKTMLMQLIRQSDGTMNERSQQLLNYLNGLQIQSVNETAHGIQANLQVPGKKLGLPDDLQLEFSGNKTEKGKINPDSCRILFYLELTHTDETIIDMHVQKRAVSITIYNERENLKEHSAVLKPVLKEGLASIDYQLSAIMFKPINDYHKPAHKTVHADGLKTYQGVDYRI